MINAKYLKYIFLLSVFLTFGFKYLTDDAKSTTDYNQIIEATQNQDVQKQEKPDVVVYYFHRTARCYSCKKIEELVKESLATKFISEVQSGKLKLELIDIQKPENKFYVQEYQLVSNSVVVTRFEDGRPKEWKLLDKVWQLFFRKSAFVNYITTEISLLLNKNG